MVTNKMFSTHVYKKLVIYLFIYIIYDVSVLTYSFIYIMKVKIINLISFN